MQNQKQSNLIIIKAKKHHHKLHIKNPNFNKILQKFTLNLSNDNWTCRWTWLDTLYAFYFHCHAWMSTKSKSKHCVHNFLTLPKAHCNLKPEINTLRHSHVFNGFIIYEKCQSLRWFFDSKSKPRPVFCFSF